MAHVQIGGEVADCYWTADTCTSDSGVRTVRAVYFTSRVIWALIARNSRA